jgi:hypothetical protein
MDCGGWCNFAALNHNTLKAMKNNRRLCLYPKDVQLITGKSYKSACRYLAKIRSHYNKEPQQLVTVAEFCAYTGIGVEEVWGLMS